MRRTLHTWNLSVKMRLKLARVEMPPRARLRMIKRRELRAAIRARPAPRIVLQPQVDARLAGSQLHPRDMPWRGDAQNRLEQCRVLQWRSFFGTGALG